MAELTVTIDATELVKAIQKGIEIGFMLANETPELDEQLNINNIDAEGI